MRLEGVPTYRRGPRRSSYRRRLRCDRPQRLGTAYCHLDQIIKERLLSTYFLESTQVIIFQKNNADTI